MNLRPYRGVISLAVGVALLYLVLPGWLVRPLNPLATFIHEAGHAFGSLLTGGSVERVVLAPGGGGYAVTAGGWPVVVASAGYVGTAVCGALCLLLNAGVRTRRFVLPGMALFLAGVTGLYGSGWLTWGYGLGSAAALGVAARFLPPAGQYHLINALGMFIGLNALESISLLVGVELGLAAQQVPDGVGHGLNDAQYLAQLTGVPAILWALAWVGLAAWLLIAAARRVVHRCGTAGEERGIRN